MTCYKLVSADFKWFGLQNRVENLIQKSERRLFTNFHRYVSYSLCAIKINLLFYSESNFLLSLNIYFNIGIIILQASILLDGSLAWTYVTRYS